MTLISRPAPIHEIQAVTAAPHRPDNLPRGIAFSVSCMFLFALMDAISRILTRDLGLPVPQILWVRFAIFFLFAVAVIGPAGFGAAFRSAMPGVQIVRAVALIFEIGIFILALGFLPLGDVHAVAAAAPLIVLVLASFMLRERVTFSIWMAVLVGMIGVFVVVRPGFRDLTWHYAIPVIGAFSWGLYQTLVRMVGRRDSANTTLAYTVAVGLVLTSLVGPFFWKWPTLLGWGLLVLSGLLGAAAHLALIKAYEACSAPRLQPFGYTLVLWAVVVGAVGLGEFPDDWTLIGAGIVIAAGVFAWLRERQVSARTAGAPSV